MWEGKGEEGGRVALGREGWEKVKCLLYLFIEASFLSLSLWGGGGRGLVRERGEGCGCRFDSQKKEKTACMYRQVKYNKRKSKVPKLGPNDQSSNAQASIGWRNT